MVFPVGKYGCESWTIKKPEYQWIDAFRLWAWRLLRVPWTARRSNQSILKEINPEYLLLKLKLRYFVATWHEEHTHWKRPWCWEKLRAGGEEGNRGWMIGRHHRLNGYKFEQTPGDSEEQGSLACCSPCGCKKLDTAKRLNNTRKL